MAAKSNKPASPREFRNQKARHNFLIGETFEAGIKLLGTEVKSIRAGKVQLNDSFARFEKGDTPVLYHMHVAEYVYGTDQNHAPTRPRVLLLKAGEIRRLKHAMEAGGQALIPLKLYFKGGLIKVELALCKGKKLHDKREDVKKREDERDARRAMSIRR